MTAPVQAVARAVMPQIDASACERRGSNAEPSALRLKVRNGVLDARVNQSRSS
jgi:hypothetical protein